MRKSNAKYKNTYQKSEIYHYIYFSFQTFEHMYLKLKIKFLKDIHCKLKH